MDWVWEREGSFSQGKASFLSPSRHAGRQPWMWCSGGGSKWKACCWSSWAGGCGTWWGMSGENVSFVLLFYGTSIELPVAWLEKDTLLGGDELIMAHSLSSSKYGTAVKRLFWTLAHILSLIWVYYSSWGRVGTCHWVCLVVLIQYLFCCKTCQDFASVREHAAMSPCLVWIKAPNCIWMAFCFWGIPSLIGWV